MLWFILPFVTFFILLGVELKWPATIHHQAYRLADWIIHLSGFLIQGFVIPCLGYWLSTEILPHYGPQYQGILPLGVIGCFCLNIFGIDCLYYLQHRAFHQINWLWKWHATHHCAPHLSVWATSRNALLTHTLFIYCWLNPIIGYLCDSPKAFFIGATLTAMLDLFRHANINLAFGRCLNGIFVLPKNHHRHHDSQKPNANYGANWIIWDRLFGTADLEADWPTQYCVTKKTSWSTQLLFPWKG